LCTFLEQLKKIVPMLEHPVEYELVAYHLREALQSLSEVTGRSVSEAAMDKVFKQFCVGK
ncbi:MAG: tRNA uridine-5-carboxymethylaminomethyl(34) synthesis GTPase MnmE, partial [Epsilonproteobacteria bacterium]|nr:tRNA uridine-5-carboxymethylaminomethyl(34) synthesis GTPase MnmE [Campylobacterota bacterium]